MKKTVAVLLAFVALAAAGCRATPVKPRIPTLVNNELEALQPIPLEEGMQWYMLGGGDTLFSVARKFHTSVAELVRLNPAVGNARALAVGTVIRVPTAGTAETPKAPPKPATPVAPKVITGLPVSAAGYVWPAQGKVVVRFGEMLPGEPAMRCRGIEIAADAGEEIRAARAGTAYVVRSSLPEFGNTIAIDHGNGVTSFYGYDLVVQLQNEQPVQRGQVIALAPSRNAGPVRVHFRIERDARPLNPLPYLPAAR